MDYEFSVLMPVYIKESPLFFTSAIESVIQQTLMPSEILIVVDGKLTDELDEIIGQYLDHYPGLFTIVRLSQNSGMGIAMDTGLRKCRFEWIARMDSDDISRPDRFELQMTYVKSHPEVDIVGGNIEEFNLYPHDLKRFRSVPMKHEEILRFSKRRCPMNHMTVLYKRLKVAQVGGYWERRNFEDYYLWCKMLQQGCIFHNLQDTLVDVRIGNNMMERRRSTAYSKDEFFFLSSLRKERYLTAFDYYRAVCIRGILRRVSPNVLEKFYKKALR